MAELCVDDRTVLRPLQLEDADALFALTDANRDHLRRWLPWLDRTRTVDDTRGFIDMVSEQSSKSRTFVAGIWHEGTLAGCIGHNSIDEANRIAYPGYWLGEAFNGRGIMTRCCRALVEHAFDELNLNRVVIFVATGNTKSAAIPTRLGFTHEGTLRDAEWLYDRFVDHDIFALLKRDIRL